MADHQTEGNKGQFTRSLRSIEAACDDASTKGMAIGSSRLPLASHPPDAILRAYSDLLMHVLVFQRALCMLRELDMNEARDLADAMHNIGYLFTDYGVHLDDEKYRELYLRPFDRRWAHEGFGLEQFLESRLRRYSN